MCTQFNSKDKDDPKQNCGMCTNYENEKCKVVDKIKKEIELERCDWCDKPADDCENYHGCRVCGECRGQHQEARRKLALAAYSRAMSKFYTKAVNTK